MVWMITLEKKYCDAILEGRKTIEVRTRIPRALVPGDYVVVVEKGTKGRVVFSFDIDCLITSTPDLLWKNYKGTMAIDEIDYLAYTKGKYRVYGLCVRKVYKYTVDLTMEDFGVYRAPQWFVKCSEF